MKTKMKKSVFKNIEKLTNENMSMIRPLGGDEHFALTPENFARMVEKVNEVIDVVNQTSPQGEVKDLNEKEIKKLLEFLPRGYMKETLKFCKDNKIKASQEVITNVRRFRTTAKTADHKEILGYLISLSKDEQSKIRNLNKV
jgi:sialic acid synthase SpsE